MKCSKLSENCSKHENTFKHTFILCYFLFYYLFKLLSKSDIVFHSIFQWHLSLLAVHLPCVSVTFIARYFILLHVLCNFISITYSLNKIFTLHTLYDLRRTTKMEKYVQHSVQGLCNSSVAMSAKAVAIFMADSYSGPVICSYG